MKKDTLKVGLAQIAPVWLKREATLEKVINYINDAAKQGVSLVAFWGGISTGIPILD